jgi:hypothetical protein
MPRLRPIEDALAAPFRPTDYAPSPGTGEWQTAHPEIPVTVGFAAFDPAGVTAFLRVVPRPGDANAVDLALSSYVGNPTLTLEAYISAGQDSSLATDILDSAISLFDGKLIDFDGGRMHMRGHSSAVPVAFLDGYSTLAVQLNFSRY